ncbi:MAG: efflux RND transporter periplasmic adaptor subunit [Proteobacteria bacterium]|nr:efflux RND transporter periplasmic adaptor subunit [Pseudomonadota bacterium]
MRLKGLVLLAVIALICVSGCHKKSNQPVNTKTTIVTAESRVTVIPLYFKGTLGPLSSQSVLSPLDGRITRMFFQYGQQINKNDPLISIEATKLAEDYRRTVTDFLQKKQAYESGLASYQGTAALYKVGAVSKEEYENAANTQKNNLLNYIQSKYELEKLLAQTNLPIKEIEQLSLANMTKVNLMLNNQFKEFTIFAPTSGIALYPPSDQKKEGGGGIIHEGDEIKAGQLILAIGDLSGFSLSVNVSEINIDLIKLNQAVKVTGDAFPGIVLNGFVTSVAYQANPQSGNEGALGSFLVQVQVPNITPEQKQIIHVGMSANVQFDIPQEAEIYLPIKAVHEVKGQRYVTVVDPSGAQQERLVVTGKTTLTEVAIISGVKQGDRVVVPH